MTKIQKKESLQERLYKTLGHVERNCIEYGSLVGFLGGIYLSHYLGQGRPVMDDPAYAASHVLLITWSGILGSVFGGATLGIGAEDLMKKIKPKKEDFDKIFDEGKENDTRKY